MENYEDEDDTHFCIKCHLTVHGLENYVRHRQSGCRGPDDQSVVRVSPSTPTTVSYPEILNADAFFSSLELRSSSKTNPRRAAVLLDENRKFKKEEKEKKVQKSDGDTEDSGAKEKVEGMLPAVSELDDPTDEHLCISSLVGFPDIVSAAASKPTATSSRNKLSQSIIHVVANIEGGVTLIKQEPESSLESLMPSHESKQTERKRQEESQRIEQVHRTWLPNMMLADLVTKSESKPLIRYDFEYHHEEYSADDMLEEDLGDDDSYSESEDGEDQERPPVGHTGGKWKPGLSDLPQNMSQLQDEYAEPEDEHQEHPPPTYTGGKWRPAESSQKIERYETKDDAGPPPPEHTQGKWVPGAQTDIESGYWCAPCGRKLASRLIYTRHLQSNLHAKRSIREMDDVLCLPRSTSPHLPRRISSRSRKPRDILEPMDLRKNVRRRRKEILYCEACRMRVRRTQMGKHLLSHYHCRVAGVNPRSPRARRVILENMANVVRQCPFQCSSCRFYCNTEETFLLHWRSELHARTLQRMGGRYKCTPCNFWCDDNETMDSHLRSTSHRDVVSMMKGSVPVVVGRQRVLPCYTCDRRFRYNLQLWLHVKETGHEGSITATDEYQQRIKCTLCPQIFRSLIALQRHQLNFHPTMKFERFMRTRRNDSIPPGPYFCSFCSMNFSTAQDAVLHRRTSSHKEIVRASKNKQEMAPINMRDCPHCSEKHPNLSEHKKHLLEKHPELCHRCPKCGSLFALSQDVTKHTRDNNCRIDYDELELMEAASVDDVWKCDSCIFSTDSRAEFIFHEALHIGIVRNDEDDSASGKASMPKYACPVCKKIFAKVSLRNHIRNHTGERPFPCPKCLASFSRRSDLSAHQKDCTGPTTAVWFDESGRRRSFACSECNSAFYTKHALRQHMLRHAGKKYKCGLPGCPTVLRTAAELKAHRTVVHDSASSNRRYRCSECSYAAKTKAQLHRHCTLHDQDGSGTKTKLHACSYAGCTFKTKIASHLQRHARLHTGTKPYKCRHCTYTSNNLENLRKHILSTNLHPGKTIYECDVCEGKTAEPFRTNFAKELRAHLLETHSSVFPTPAQANSYIHAIFEDD